MVQRIAGDHDLIVGTPDDPAGSASDDRHLFIGERIRDRSQRGSGSHPVAQIPCAEKDPSLLRADPVTSAEHVRWRTRHRIAVDHPEILEQ